MTSLVDLFEFLSSPNPSARHLALQNLVGHTPKNAALRHIFVPSALAPVGSGSSAGAGAGVGSAEDRRKIQGIKDLMELCRDQALIAHDALSALINLSDNLAVARHIAAEEDYLVWLVSYTANTTSPLSPLTSMLLSNLSSHPSLLPALATLSIPLIPLPQSRVYPPYYLPASASSSATIHPDYRDPQLALRLPPSAAGQEAERPVEAVRALVQAFEDGAADGVTEGKGKRKGECHFLSSVFANVSTVPKFRKLLITPYPPFPLPSSSSSPASSSAEYEPLLSKLVPFTSHPDTIRRGGVLGTIKNIALDRACHGFLLAGEDDRVRLASDAGQAGGSEAGEKNGQGEGQGAEGEEQVVKGVDVLPYVLGPLMGGEEYDIEEMDQLPATLQFLPPEKRREQDTVLRMMCVEILLLLSTTYTGRETLRKRGTYFVVRELHKVEPEQQIKDAVERLVGLLQGDEGAETRGDLVENLVRGETRQTATAGAGATSVATSAGTTSEPDRSRLEGEDDDLGGEIDVIGA